MVHLAHATTLVASVITSQTLIVPTVSLKIGIDSDGVEVLPGLSADRLWPSV